jgi:serine/threonine protein kinase
MGVVWLARERSLDREVALKTIRFAGDGDRRADRIAMLDREARATAALRHPNVVVVHRFGATEDRFYFVLERLHGTTLADRLERGPLPLAEVLDVAEQALAGLAHAHDAGIIHRDLKPQNVFLEGGGRVKLLDFGLASAAVPIPGVASGSRRRAGTPAYMAPEQRRGDPVDERADVWAMGVMLFEMSTGHLPWRQPGSVDAAPAIGPELAHAPAALRPLIARSLALRPFDRPSSAVALLADLQALRRRLRRRRVAGRIAGAAVIALAAALSIPAGIVVHRHVVLDPETIDLSGRWRYDPHPAGIGDLTRVSSRFYHFRYTNGSLDRLDPEHSFFAGDLEVDQSINGRVWLRGRMRDLPGSSEHNYGVIEFEMLSPDQLWMSRSHWGAREGQVTIAHEPWLMIRAE